MRRKNMGTGIICTLMMLLLILDGKATLSGAAEGIQLCLQAVIPSLFPFFILGNMITAALAGSNLRVLRPLCRLCRLHSSGSVFLILGFLGGYPIGAQAVFCAYQSKSISRPDANRLLSFCNNAGPAFIFGMAATLFTNPFVAWMLWGIHIASAVLTAVLIPGSVHHPIRQQNGSALTLSQAVERSAKAMLRVCAWVIVFRVIHSLLSRWVLWMLGPTLRYIIAGLLELTNGCTGLYEIAQEGLRFILCSCFLSFGGICVALQTKSVIGTLDIRAHLIGKSLQLLLSFILSAFTQAFLFQGFDAMPIPWLTITMSLVILALTVVFLRKSSSISAMHGV